MEKKKYLKYYEEWSKTDLLPYDGLCNSLTENQYPLVSDKLVDLFAPTSVDEEKYDVRAWGYWGDTDMWCCRAFNDFRKNILLFCAAINGEL